MFWRRKPSISDALKDWINDSFDWGNGAYGTAWRDSRRLITPTKAYFTAGSGQTPLIAQQIADDIARLIPVPAIPVSPIPSLPDEYRHTYQELSGVGGLYIDDGDTRTIQYDATQMRTPMAFINTMTHELMHDRLASFVHDMPGGAQAHELSTDLHCITHGFGIFALEGPSQLGWSGYMTTESRAYALAVFLDRHDQSPDNAFAYLNSRTTKALRRALAEYAVDAG